MLSDQLTPCSFPLTPADMEAQFETHCEGLESEERSRAARIKRLTDGSKGLSTSPPEPEADLEDPDDPAFSPVPPVPFSYGGPNAAALIAQALQARAELFPVDNSSFGPVSGFSDGAASVLRKATSALDSHRQRMPQETEEGSSPPQDTASDPNADSWDDDTTNWQPNQASLVEGHHRQRRRRLSSSEGFLGAAALGLAADEADELLPDLDV